MMSLFSLQLPVIRRPRLSSNTLRAPALALAVALIAPLAVAADEVTLTKPMMAHQGYSQERCLQAAAGSTLEFSFEGANPVDFNIHHHPDQGPTVFAVRETAIASLAKVVPIASGGEYCFQWTNSATYAADYPIELHYRLR